MDIKQYLNKKVKITDFEGRVFVGIVSEYIYPEDNEPEIESVIVDINGEMHIEFYESSIKTIEIL